MDHHPDEDVYDILPHKQLRHIPSDLDTLQKQVMRLFKDVLDIDDGKKKPIPEKLQSYLNKEKQESLYFSFLVRLDSAVYLDQILSSAPVERLKTGFTALNSTVEETGLLLVPRVKSVSDDDTSEEEVLFKRNWIGRWLPGMNQSLKNTYYMETSALAANGIHFSVRHRIVDNLVFHDRRYIRIAFSPLLRNPRLDVQCYKKGGRVLFSVSDLSQKDEIKGREEAAFALACQEKADVLVFPEMLGDKGLVAPEEGYSEILDVFAIKAEKDGLQAPHIIFSPTWWHDRRNKLHAFDNMAWRLCIQQKQFPYAYPNPEDGKNIWKT